MSIGSLRQGVRDKLRVVQDTMTNLVSGLGTVRDKNYHAQWVLNVLDPATLELMYRSDWISRKVVDAPAEDATREWRAWQAEKDQIDKIEDAEATLGVRSKLQRAMKMARLYGGGALLLGVEGQGTPDKELIPEKVTAEQLKFVHPLSCHQLSGTELEGDLLSPHFGQPKMYQVHTIAAGTNPVSGQQQVHPSRVVRLLGRELPDDRSAGLTTTWGDSILQAVEDTLRYAGAVSGNIAALTNEAKIDVIRIPNLSENLSTQEYANRLQTRFTLANQLKSTINTLLLDKEEEWERTQASFAGLPDVLKMYLLLAAGAADIPATRLLGQSPQGMNSTGDNDMRNYYDRVSSDQETRLSPAIERLDEVLVRSALGDRPEELFYEWNSLWQMTDTEKADIAVKKATVMSADVAAGLIPIPALRAGRENQLIEDGTYPGIELSLEEFENEETTAELAMEGQRKLLAAPAPGEEPDAEDPDAEEEPDFGDAGRKRKKLFRKTGSGEYKRIGGKGKTYNLAQVRLLYARGGSWDSGVRDAQPRTLYVRRNVLNAETVIKWAKSQGFETTLPASDMHVTVAFSKSEVDWTKIREDWQGGEDGTVTIAEGGMRMLERFGQQGDAVVLAFSSSRLAWRHEEFRSVGASWDHPDYVPHVAISYDAPNIDVRSVVPYRGKLVLGPEIFEEVKAKWMEGVREDHRPFDDEGFDPSKHPRHSAGTEGGKGGQFAPKGTTAERVRWRKQLRQSTDPEERQKLRQAIMDSFVRHQKRAKSKGDLSKAAELEGKIQKYSKLYKIPVASDIPTTMKAANIGYTQAETKAAESVMASTLGPGVSYTPAEKAHFNDLVQVGGEANAKSWSLAAKNSIGSAPAGMSPGELSHVVAYTGSGYQTVNKQLREGVMDERMWGHVNRLNGALEKFPDYKHDVWRHVNRKNVNTMLYKPGYIVEERGFTSSSFNPKSPSSDSVIFHITSLTGKDVSKVSNYKHEGEVLFRSGTRFKILSNDNSTVRMQEVRWVDDQ